ncbi:metallophosphoesterase [bacterium]|nr:metallophosphoesterase [bacterium]
MKSIAEMSPVFMRPFLAAWLCMASLHGAEINRPWTPAAQDRFSFAVIGDRTGAGPDNWKIFDRAVAEINLMNPDFVIMVGDLVEGAGNRTAELDRQWEEALTHLAPLKAPLYMVPGNHDVYNPMSYDAWQKRLGKTYFAFAVQDCRFVMLNTEEGKKSGQSGLGSEQMDFLRAQLREPCAHVFIVMHQPMWMMDTAQKAEWRNIETLLGNRAFTVIAGHLHVLAAKRENGNLYLVQGPTGAGMRMDRNPALGLFHHFTWIHVADGSPSVAIIEPGRIMGEDTAIRAYQTYGQGMMMLGK